MATYQLGGKEIRVDRYITSWPISIFYMRQGVEIKVNPERHWWCLWICTSTDAIDEISCKIELTGKVLPQVDVGDSCRNCGDLTVEGPAFWGVSLPRQYEIVNYAGSVKIAGTPYAFTGSMQFT
jgi:hypothetical protein